MNHIHGSNSMDGHPHGMMRRDDREITDRNEIDDIINSSKVMYLSLADNNTPFCVPVFYAYDGQYLYFHSAKGGSKIDILNRNNQVCFVISTQQDVIESDLACNFEAKHKTAIGTGSASFIENKEEKIAVLDKIVGLFTTKKFDYPDANLKSTLVVKIAIESVKGKKHGF
ncbi:pyridoxamine 5'-phosphate oxidase family protein [uncultured Tolumonas sp.]|uniref:pyridoxamine 5'-phosphate oxidase family protein n=1 Tax=uncultured Tolumonas sp. TaxID=263765 RepID=UPI00292E5814|nr:pyridoxamine 5'-phosphate oxidase family protein [uncultured Tolumonas sp.]